MPASTSAQLKLLAATLEQEKRLLAKLGRAFQKWKAKAMTLKPRWQKKAKAWD